LSAACRADADAVTLATPNDRSATTTPIPVTSRACGKQPGVSGPSRPRPGHCLHDGTTRAAPAYGVSRSSRSFWGLHEEK